MKLCEGLKTDLNMHKGRKNLLFSPNYDVKGCQLNDAGSIPSLLYKSISIQRGSSIDKQRICVNMQLKSSKKLLKLNACVLKSNSFDPYAIPCDVIAYHFVYFLFHLGST